MLRVGSKAVNRADSTSHLRVSLMEKTAAIRSRWHCPKKSKYTLLWRVRADKLTEGSRTATQRKLPLHWGLRIHRSNQVYNLWHGSDHTSHIFSLSQVFVSVDVCFLYQNSKACSQQYKFFIELLMTVG